MGQHYRHEDTEVDQAGDQIYEAISDCRNRLGIPDSKIIEAMIAELHGLSHDLQRHTKEE